MRRFYRTSHRRSRGPLKSERPEKKARTDSVCKCSFNCQDVFDFLGRELKGYEDEAEMAFENHLSDVALMEKTVSDHNDQMKAAGSTIHNLRLECKAHEDWVLQKEAEIAALKKRADDLANASTCVICKDRRADALFEPCMHLVCCSVCYHDLRAENTPVACTRCLDVVKAVAFVEY